MSSTTLVSRAVAVDVTRIGLRAIVPRACSIGVVSRAGVDLASLLIANMTIYDHINVMKKAAEKSVKIAQLKAQLSAFVRAARRGHSVVVCERNTPVARLVPYKEVRETLTVREPTRAWGATKMPVPLGPPVDSLAALLEERQSSR